MKSFIAILLLFMASPWLYSQTEEQIFKWNTMLQQDSLPIIVQILDAPEPLPWPKLISDASASSSKMGNSKPSELAYRLFIKIQAFENTTSRGEQDTRKAVMIYGKLSKCLLSQGGFENLCLPDTLNRLVVARLIELLIQQPASVSGIPYVLHF